VAGLVLVQGRGEKEPSSLGILRSTRCFLLFADLDKKNSKKWTNFFKRIVL
jgi:hypothetical protein